MEKESVPEGKGAGLPVPASLQKVQEAYAVAATPNPAHRRKQFRFLAAFALAVLLGSTAFSFMNRSLEIARLSHLHKKFDPDARGKLTVQETESKFLEVPDETSAIETSKLYATKPHLAGSKQDFETATYFLDLLHKELGITPPNELPIFDAGSPESREATLGIPHRGAPAAWIDKYFPVMNTPLGRALDIVDDEGVAVWKANVEETVEEGDPAGEYAHTIGAWHGLSAPGDVTGPAVYVNYGRKKDFDQLIEAGVDLKGTIAVARYGGVFRGLKVKAAHEAGCIGILIYTDPRDHGSVTEEAGYKPYPEGPAVNPHSVQRGSVQYLSIYPGDPTTPGYPSYPNATRTEGRNIPGIPSLPISWTNGKRILDEINPSNPFTLDGTLSKRRIRLLNQVDTRVIPIWNTMGVIPGHIRDEIVILGNHRDAWVNGAADPTSGTVTIVEIIKGLGRLLREGWTPLRTIVIASWDAEEYGLIGSTEYGEDFADFLAEHIVAYLNVDVSNAGSNLIFGGSPSLAHLVRGVAQSLPHPTDKNRSLWDARDDTGPFTGPPGFNVELGADLQTAIDLRASMSADIRSIDVHPLGSGSDYTVFLQRIGIASIDGGFKGTHSDAVYHYHSVYDSHRWQTRFSDPGFFKQVAVAKYLGLVTLRVADSIVLPINTTQYTLELGSYLSKVEAIAKKQALTLDLRSLRKAISKVHRASTKLDHAKHKAEKKLRKALFKLGKKVSRHGHRKHWRMCLRRRWNKLKNFVRSVFGVHPDLDEHDAQAHTSEYEEIPLYDVQSAQAIAWEEGKVIPVEGAPIMIKLDDLPEGKPSTIGTVRVGLAGAQSPPSDKREERRSFVDKVRVGKAGAGKWGNKRDTTLQRRDSNTGHPDRDGENHGHHRSRPCTRSREDIDIPPWIVSPGASVPKRGPLRKVLKAARAVRRVNVKLAGFERGFIHEDGIKDREWYRHLGVAPGKWLGYGATTFPALTEALEEKNSTLANAEAERLAKNVNDLAKFLGL